MKERFVIGGLCVLFVVGVILAVIGITSGHYNEGTLYTLACGPFAAMLIWLRRQDQQQKAFIEKAAHEMSAFSEERVQRIIKRLDRQGKFPIG